MSLGGALDTMPAGDVFGWLETRARSGRLEFSRGDVRRWFEVVAGHVTGCGSSEAEERLSQALLGLGVISEEQANEAVKVSHETGVQLGRILLMTDALTEEQLESALADKIRESMVEVLCWQDGSFSFTPSASSSVPIEPKVPLATLLADAAELAPAWQRMLELIPSIDCALFIIDQFAAVLPDHSQLQRNRIETLIDGVERGLSVRDVIVENHGQRYMVLTELAGMVERGAIGVRRAAESAQQLDPNTAAERATTLEAAGQREQALATVNSGLELDKYDEVLIALKARLERSLFAQLSRQFLTSFRVPKLLKDPGELESLELTRSERYLASRVDGRWDLLSLLRQSPLPEVEALITFKRLADRGIITL